MYPKFNFVFIGLTYSWLYIIAKFQSQKKPIKMIGFISKRNGFLFNRVEAIFYIPQFFYTT